MTSHQLDGQTEIKMAGDTSSTTSQLDGLQKHEQTVLETEKEDDLEAELHISTWLVVFAINLLGTALLAEIVGAGAFAQNITGTLGNTSRSAWFSLICFALTAILGPPVAQGADLFGRRWFCLLCCAFGIAGNIVIGRASSFAMVIVGFCIAGPCFATQGLTYAIVSEVLPRKWRGYATASLGITQAAIAIAAILAGSKLASVSPEGWRNYFYIIAGFFAVCMIVLYFFYRPPPRPVQRRYSRMERLKSMDWIGFSLLAAGLLLLIVGVAFGNNPYPWKSANVLAPLILGLIFSGAFVLYEWKGTSTGFAAHALFGDRNLAIQIVGTMLEGAAFAGVNNYFIFEIIVFFHYTPLEAGYRFSMFFVCTAFWSVVFGIIVTRTKRLRPTLLMGVLMTLSGTVALHFVSPDKTGEQIAWAVHVLLGGLGAIMITQNTAAQMSAAPELIGAVSAVMLSARSLGGAIGAAVYATQHTSVLQTNVAAKVPPAILQAGLAPQYIGQFIGALTTQNTAGLMAIPGITPAIIGAGANALVQAFEAAFKRVWLIVIILWAICFVVSVFTLDPKSKFTGLVDAPVDDNLKYRTTHGEVDQKAAEQRLESVDTPPAHHTISEV